MTPAEHIAAVLDSAKDVDVPADIRAEHQPDPNKITKGAQCVCTCGTACIDYAGHLVDAAEHRALWDRMCAERGHPAEAFARAGIDLVSGRPRISRDEFARQLLDELRFALDNDLLTTDQLRALIGILGPVAERAKHGGPTAAEVERN